MTRYIDADDFFDTFEELDTEPYTNFPTVDPVRHGHWLPLEADGYADDNPVYDLWECSECGEEHEGEEHTLTPYCPWCGAKMNEVNE